MSRIWKSLGGRNEILIITIQLKIRPPSLLSSWLWIGGIVMWITVSRSQKSNLYSMTLLPTSIYDISNSGALAPNMYLATACWILYSYSFVWIARIFRAPQQGSRESRYWNTCANRLISPPRTGMPGGQHVIPQYSKEATFTDRTKPGWRFFFKKKKKTT